MNARPKTIDQYLATASPAHRALLQKLRATIRAAAPKAEECISYGLAAFKLDGKALVAFGAWKEHCAFYPMSGSCLAAHRDALAKFETSKGTIRFTVEQPLPATLVRKMVRFRIAQNREKAAGR